MPAMSLPKISIAIACLAAASPAYAHFKLETPASWTTLAADGAPQKLPPCGNEGVPPATSPVTEYKAGATISISFLETKFHPGHYRVSLAADQASLPADPSNDVVPGENTACGSLAINPNPTMPLIADGLLVHTRPFTGTQTMQVTLPAGVTCDHCVLQIVQFMSDHATPCFYHHCANVKIIADAPPGGGGVDGGVGGSDGGVGGGIDAGAGLDGGVIAGGGDDAGVTGGSSGGGGCSVAGTDITGVALLALTVGLVLARRRRR